MKLFRILFLAITFLSINLNAQETRLVTDFVAGPDSGFRNDALILGTAGNSIAILNGDDIILSDGTGIGTKVIGTVGTNGGVSNIRTVLDGKIYFIINNEEENYSLIEIDVEKEEMNSLLSGYDYISNLLAYKHKLYCNVDVGSSNNKFISVDPLNGSMENIFEMNWFGGMRDAIVHNDMIYSIHWKNGADGAYLSRSDGTPGNVNEFAFLHDGSEFSQTASINMTSAGDNLFFFYYSSSSDYAMYVSDGTDEGTIVLQEGMKRISFYDYDVNRAVGTIGNSIFFRGVLDGEPNNKDLWISDGTIEGTCTLKLVDEEEVEPELFTNYMGKLYFYGYNRGGFFPKLGMIESDGTKEGTKTPYDAYDHEDKLYYTGWQMTSHQDQLFFSAESSDYGSELYASEGPLETITRVSELAEGDNSSSIRKLTSAGENLFFIASNGIYGRELYVYGPPALNTNTIAPVELDIFPNPATSYIQLPDTPIDYISIFDLSGKLIKEVVHPTAAKINVENLLSGWYAIRFLSENTLYTSRFYKM